MMGRDYTHGRTLGKVGPFAWGLVCLSLTLVSAGQQLTILYSSDNHGVLQSCGCSTGQFGGLARQAFVIEAERNSGGAALVIDGGNLAPDRGRALIVLRCLNAIGYDGVVLTAADEQLGERFLTEAVKMGVSMVGTVVGSQRLLLKEVEGERLALCGLQGDETSAFTILMEALQEADRRQARILIVSSDCGEGVDRQIARLVVSRKWSPVTRRDVILFSRGLAEPIHAEMIHLLPAPSEGKAVSRVNISVVGGELLVKSAFLPVTNDLPEDRRVASIVEEYYRDSSTKLTVTSDTQSTERLTQPYAESNQCVDCHGASSRSVAEHRHSRAVETLKEKERLVPECLTCHSELYRRTQRWHPEDPLAGNGVECATCHGDGILHSQIGTKESVTRKAPEKLCRSCHTPEQDPKFDYVKRLEAIRHWK